MTFILKDIFGDTKKIRILEELVENWGEFLTIEEIARIAETSKKTTYMHIKELMEIGILEYDFGKPTRFKFKEDDKRALTLAILESEEYLRKSEITLKYLEEKEAKELSYKSFREHYELESSGSGTINYQSIGEESK